MVSGSNQQRYRRHGNENQDLFQVKGVVERRHQRKKKDSWERENEKTALRGGDPAECRALEVNSAVQEKNESRLPVDP